MSYSSSSSSSLLSDDFVSSPISDDVVVSSSILEPSSYENWINKPLNDYSVSEGLLLFLVISVLFFVVLKIFDLN